MEINIYKDKAVYQSPEIVEKYRQRILKELSETHGEGESTSRDGTHQETNPEDDNHENNHDMANPDDDNHENNHDMANPEDDNNKNNHDKDNH